MADTLFPIPADKLDAPELMFTEPSLEAFRDEILMNRDRIDRAECYTNNVDIFKIKVMANSNPFIASFNSQTGYDTAKAILKG
jgi:hypothetical protein